MIIVSTLEDLEAQLSDVRKSAGTIGFVPTMGALHEGHLTLVRNSVAQNKFTVISIFVNPTQFNNAEDLAKYPRTLERDAEKLQSAGADLIFAPSSDVMYSESEINQTYVFDFQGLDKVMEGKFRPGHFNGVVQVVKKLFDLVNPDKAYFGEKDFQQLAIIHHMVKSFGLKVDIVDCPIVRETSGLAMSSRNERLNGEELNIASNISRILFESRNFAAQMKPSELKEWVEKEIVEEEGLELEYFELANAETLQTLNSWDEPAVGCIAVFCGAVRLIDNVRYN